MPSPNPEPQTLSLRPRSVVRWLWKAEVPRAIVVQNLSVLKMNLDFACELVGGTPSPHPSTPLLFTGAKEHGENLSVHRFGVFCCCFIFYAQTPPHLIAASWGKVPSSAQHQPGNFRHMGHPEPELSPCAQGNSVLSKT